jgi:hypothetical protein
MVTEDTLLSELHQSSGQFVGVSVNQPTRKSNAIETNGGYRHVNTMFVVATQPYSNSTAWEGVSLVPLTNLLASIVVCWYSRGYE